jgi:hypothetical protein
LVLSAALYGTKLDNIVGLGSVVAMTVADGPSTKDTGSGEATTEVVVVAGLGALLPDELLPDELLDDGVGTVVVVVVVVVVGVALARAVMPRCTALRADTRNS